MKDETLIFGRISLAQLFKAQDEFVEYLERLRENITFKDILKLQRLYKKATLGLADPELEKPIQLMFLTGIIRPKLLAHISQFVFLDVTRKALRWTEEVKRKPTSKRVYQL